VKNKISQTISEIIKNSKPQFTLGITGKWGTGKTTLMKTIQKIFEDSKERTTPTVWFDAWRFEREQGNATIPLLLTILSGLNNWLKVHHEDYHDDFKKKFKRYGKTLSGSITIGIEGIASGTLNIDPDKTPPFKNMLDSFREKNTPTLQDGIELIKSSTEIIHLDPTQHLKLVVFIDDLDRCSPPKALEVLESIKILLNIKGIVFVVGISDRTIYKLIDIQYKDTGITGKDYVKKINQVEYPLREWDHADIIKIIKKDILDELGDNAPDLLTNVQTKEKNYEMISQIIEANPRELKRFLNNLIISFALLPKKDEVDVEKFLIIKAFKSRWEDYFIKFRNEKSPLKDFIENHIEKDHHEIKGVINSLRKDSGESGNIHQDYKIIEEIPIELWEFIKDVKDKLYSITPEQWPLYLGVSKSMDRMEKTPSEENDKKSDSVKIPEKRELLRMLRTSVMEFNEMRTNTNYVEIDLQRANLQDANLQRANLQDANLWDANLQDANLQRANLQDANLRDANLQDANLQRADLKNVKNLLISTKEAKERGAINIPEDSK